MFGFRFNKLLSTVTVLHFFLVLLCGFFDSLIINLNQGLSTQLVVLPTAIWLLFSGHANLLSKLLSTIFMLWLMSTMGLFDLYNIVISFGFMLLIILPLSRLLPVQNNFELHTISLKILSIAFFITVHFLVLNYGLGTLEQYSTTQIKLAILGNVAFSLILIWLFNLSHYFISDEHEQLPVNFPRLILALVVFTIVLIGIVALSADYIKYLAIFSILPGLWFCHKHRWAGCAGFVTVSNLVLLGFIAHVIIQYDPALPLTQKAYLLNELATQTNHFEQYSRISLGITLYETVWFLCLFNLIGILISAMLYELDLAQSKLLNAQSNLSLTNTHLREVNHNIRNVNQLLVNAQEYERQQLAKEINISLRENIKTIDSALSVIESDCSNPDTVDTFQSLNTYSGHIHRSLHEIVHKLKPQMLTRDGLYETLKGDYFKDKLALFKVNYSFIYEPNFITLSDNISIAVYRVVQEAVNNTIKYANASHFTIELKTTPAALSLIIKDDGVGFDPAHKTSGFGLEGMQQRILALEGTFQIDTRSGTQINITIPLTI